MKTRAGRLFFGNFDLGTDLKIYNLKSFKRKSLILKKKPTSRLTHGKVSVPLPIPEPEPVAEADSLVLPILLLDASESLLDSVTAPR